MFCPQCGSNIGNQTICPQCGASVSSGEPFNTETPTVGNDTQPPFIQQPVGPGVSPIIPKGGKATGIGASFGRKKTIIAIVAVALVIVLAISGAVAAAALSKPTVKVARALEKTLFDCKGFSIKAEADFGYGETYEAEGYIKWGKTLGETQFFGECQEYGIYGAGIDGNATVGADGMFVSASYASAYEKIIDIATQLAANEDINALAADYLGSDVDLGAIVEIIKSVVKDENLNEKTFEELYNIARDKAPEIIEVYEANSGEELDLDPKDIPTYSQLKGIISDYFMGIGGDEIEVTDTHKEDGVKCYDVKVHTAELITYTYNFIKDCKKLQPILEIDGIDDEFEDIGDEIEDGDFEDYVDDIKFTVGIKNGFIALVEADLDQFGEEGSFTLKLDDFNKPPVNASDLDYVNDIADDGQRLEITDDMVDTAYDIALRGIETIEEDGVSSLDDLEDVWYKLMDEYESELMQKAAQFGFGGYSGYYDDGYYDDYYYPYY